MYVFDGGGMQATIDTDQMEVRCQFNFFAVKYRNTWGKICKFGNYNDIFISTGLVGEETGEAKTFFLSTNWWLGEGREVGGDTNKINV